MQSNTTIRSWPALVIGGFFTGITEWVLLADVIKLFSRCKQLPSQDTLAACWREHKAPSNWCSDFERRGLIRRTWVGRHNRIAEGSSAPLIAYR